MAFEAYPLIVGDSAFSIFEECDETCYLNACSPFSLEIQIIDASLSLDSLTVNYSYQDNLDSLMIESKRLNDSLKILQVNSNIQQNNMIWVAGSNSLSELNYHDKRKIFGEKYNLLGLDYYMGGLFDPFPNDNPLTDNSNLIKHYDWRQRHDADSNTSFYYDNDPDHFYKPCQNLNIHETGNGWMTGIRDQDPCSNYCKGTCYIFAPLAAFEGLANIYFNHHIDYDLSEQHVLDCDMNKDSTQCNGGSTHETAIFAKTFGVVDEGSYPWLGNYSDECPGDPPVPYPEYQVKIRNWQYVNNPADIQNIKSHLVDYGPMCVTINYAYSYHAMALVGFGEVSEESLLHNFSGWELEDISEYLGQTYWIFKNSYTPNWGEGGYMYHAHTQFGLQDFTYYPVPIDDIWSEEDTIRYRDADRDGYWNWGIVDEPPESLTTLCGPDPIKDWNDNNNRIGNCDENYHGLPVKPGIAVYFGNPLQAPDTVLRNQFIRFHNENTTTPFNLHFTIENTGNAQLNLDRHGILDQGEVLLSNESSFSIDEYPPLAICWGEDQQQGFDILYSHISFEQSITKVTIKINEPDIEDFVFFLVFENCNDADGEVVIHNPYELWDTDRVITTDIKIATGAELEITGTIAFLNEGDIIVEQGARLTLNGGVIGSACDVFWNGIDLRGDPELPQTTLNQGMIDIINSGRIQMARTAIETLNADQTPSGGIIHAVQAIFMDNQSAVKLYPFENKNPSGEPMPNLSSFRQCQFIFGDFLFGQATETNQGIYLWDVDGIRILGCDFLNQAVVDGKPVSNNATGIFSFDAGFYLSNDCVAPGSVPCTIYKNSYFEHLDYGIYAISDRPTKLVTVDSVAFCDNKRGVYLGALSTPQIFRSSFISNTENSAFPSSEAIVGIYLEKCTQYQIEENVFTDMRSTGQQTIGIHVLNSQPVYNEIYNNSFMDTRAGIVAAGENRDDLGEGLCIKCNRFASCDYDIYITPEGGSDPDRLGIAENQGETSGGQSNALAAGNIFSDYTGIELNYSNDLECNPIKYTHHNDILTEYKIVPFPFFPSNEPLHLKFIEDQDASFALDESCPSHLGGPGIQPDSEQITLSSEIALIQSYEDTLAQETDGGDTYGLNFEVNSSFPDEALQVRQQLLDESPYLSDTVMKTAIEKDDVLPNAMIRDVLVLNPQSAKSNEIVDMLDERIDPMPDYMMDEIMQGKSVLGAKELIEKNLSFHSSVKNRAMSNLVHFYKMDTSMFSTRYDSIVNVLTSDPSLFSSYTLVSYYFEDDDSTQAFSLLDDIPFSFTLSTGGQVDHVSFCYLVNLQWALKHSIQIDSISILSLSELSINERSLAGIYSRNILINQKALSYTEPVFLPNSFKTSETIFPFIPDSIKKDYLRVFPNPAGNYFIIEYNLESFNSKQSSIRITNLTGKFIYNRELGDSQNQFVVPTFNFVNGFYMIQLWCNHKLIDTAKISISK